MATDHTRRFPPPRGLVAQRQGGIGRRSFLAGERLRARKGWILSYVLLFGLLGMAVASGATAMAAFVVLGVYATLGRGNAVRALALSWFLTLINPDLTAGSGSASVGRYVVLLGVLVSAVVHGTIRSHVNRGRLFIYVTLLLGIVIIIHAFLFSQVQDVSILKATAWTLTMCALLACWIGMAPDEREEAIGQLFWGLTLLALFSLPLAVLPTGYRTNGTGFQGLLNQPQAFGLTMGLLAAWTAVRLLAERRPSWLSIGICGLSLAFVLLSESRTAGLGVLGGVLLSIFVAPVLSGRSFSELFPGLASARVWGAGFVVLAAALMALPFVIGTIGDFMTKRGSGQGLTNVYQESRGRLIQQMLVNVEEHSLTGIGFGVASDYMTMEVERDSVTGLPMSAPIEKGFIFLAVFEELGAVLFFLVILWLLFFARVCARGGGMSFSVFSVIILFNFGEGTFFSPGGMGGLFAIFLTWAYAHGASLPGSRHA